MSCRAMLRSLRAKCLTLSTPHGWNFRVLRPIFAHDSNSSSLPLKYPSRHFRAKTDRLIMRSASSFGAPNSSRMDSISEMVASAFSLFISNGPKSVDEQPEFIHAVFKVAWRKIKPPVESHRSSPVEVYFGTFTWRRLEFGIDFCCDDFVSKHRPRIIEHYVIGALTQPQINAPCSYIAVGGIIPLRTVTVCEICKAVLV